MSHINWREEASQPRRTTAMPYSVVRLSVGLSEHVMFTSLFMLINTQRHVYIIINKYVN